MDNGSLKTIKDLLSINGFNSQSIKELQILCDPASIPDYVVPDENQMPPEFIEAYTIQDIDYGHIPELNEDSSANQNTQIPGTISWYTERIEKCCTKMKLAVEPKRHKILPNNIHTFTVIDQSLTGINWTQFSRYDASDWKKGVCINDGFIQDALPVLTDDHLCQKIQKLAPIINRIPVSDVYVLETNSKLNLNAIRNTLSSKATFEIVQLSQLNTILTTILTNRASTTFGTIDNLNVYFIGSTMVGKFFGLQLGKETVSTQPMVRDILMLQRDQMENDGFVIDLSKEWRDLFFKSFAAKREGLGKSLLIGLTFVHLGLHK